MINSNEVLQFLECQPGVPGIRFLNRLVTAYVRKVPWESAFRIAKRASTAEQANCPRWPDEFWHDAIHRGGGGTCFESNYAFFHLLKQSGFSGYLTVNNMGDEIACHSAIIINLDGRKVLVDVGIPLHAVITVKPDQITRRRTWLHTYTVRPNGVNRYQIERSNHPHRNIYTLLDSPVGEQEYRKVVEQDYGENGNFLKRVILVKVIGDRLWRFNSEEVPYRLEGFGARDKQTVPISNGQAPRVLAERFQMDERKIAAAFDAIMPTS